jgi:hypothetical protein
MPSTVFTSLPASAKFSLRVCRKWKGIDDAVSDDDVINQALIDPNLVALILQIVQQVISCIPNSKMQGFNRVKSFLTLKPMEKLADQMRLHSITNYWLLNLGVPREAGDVVAIRNAMSEAAGELQTADDFAKIQTEILWTTI